MNIESLKKVKDNKINEEIKLKEKFEKEEEERNISVQGMLNQIGIFDNIKKIESNLYSSIKNIPDDKLQKILESCIERDYEADSFNIYFEINIPIIEIHYLNENAYYDDSIKKIKINTSSEHIYLSYTHRGCFYSISLNCGFENPNFNYNIGYYYNSNYWEKKTIYEKLNTEIYDKLKNHKVNTYGNRSDKIDGFSLLPNVESVSDNIYELLISRLEEFGCKIINSYNTDVEFSEITGYECKCGITIKNPLNEE